MAAAALLDEIEREAVPVVLRRFDLGETSAFLATHGMEGLDPGLVLALLRVTGGNPLFLRRIAALGAPDPARSLPAGVHAAIEQAVTDLSDGARRALQAGAVLGLTSSVSEAAAVAGCDPAAVLAAVDEGVSAGLVLAEGPARFTFSHELVRAALEDALGPADSLDAHATAAAVVAGDSPAMSTDRLRAPCPPRPGGRPPVARRRPRGRRRLPCRGAVDGPLVRLRAGRHAAVGGDRPARAAGSPPAARVAAHRVGAGRVAVRPPGRGTPPLRPCGHGRRARGRSRDVRGGGAGPGRPLAQRAPVACGPGAGARPAAGCAGGSGARGPGPAMPSRGQAHRGGGVRRRARRGRPQRARRRAALRRLDRVAEALSLCHHALLAPEHAALAARAGRRPGAGGVRGRSRRARPHGPVLAGRRPVPPGRRPRHPGARGPARAGGRPRLSGDPLHRRRARRDAARQDRPAGRGRAGGRTVLRPGHRGG